MFQVLVLKGAREYSVIATSMKRAVEIRKEVSEYTTIKTWCGAHGWQPMWMGCCRECMLGNAFKQVQDERI